MSILATGNLKQASDPTKTAAPNSRTTYARAVREYDDEFKQRLTGEISRAIAEASIVSDANIMALRVGETLEALTTVLISFAAMSPQFDVPSELRKFSEGLAKRVRCGVARARAEGAFDHLGARKGGTA